MHFQFLLRKGFLALSLLVLCVMLIPLDSMAATYELNIRNRTPQLLTSSVCAVHRKGVEIFAVGETAPSGLSDLAEDGVVGGYRATVQQLDGVRSVKVSGFISAGSRRRITLNARRSARLSCVLGMLVVTNDGFPAFLNMRLPRRVGQRKRIRARAYDAGSEVNTESCAHVPGGPCDAHFVGDAENGTVQPHPNIQGIADLSATRHGWREPAVRGFIRRVR